MAAKRLAITVIILAFILVAILVTGVRISIIGDTGSMEPTFSGGEILITARAKEYKVGDIISFKSPETDALIKEELGSVGWRDYIMHRIVEVNRTGIITKGDGINHVDPWIITPEHIRGKVVWIIP